MINLVMIYVIIFIIMMNNLKFFLVDIFLIDNFNFKYKLKLFIQINEINHLMYYRM